ncbi:MAG: hydrogen gas-evolving membrane-bound hydrogenase subunit E [Trueperaceae bacterium]|nr:hydrogen gas-evolving membrane-bound hydrogenase subunit E [Trueperaceae bacterium]
MLTLELLLLLAVTTPLVAALLSPWWVRGFERLGARRLSGSLAALAFVPALLLVVWGRGADEPVAASLVWVGEVGLELALRADGFSLLLTLVVAAVGVLVCLYAAAYLAPGERHGRFYGLLLLFGAAMLGLVLVDNLAGLIVFWELTSISSFLLIGFWDHRRASREGALKAFLVTFVGGLGLLVGVILIGVAGGSFVISELDVAAIRQSPLFVPALSLILLAAFTKSAQVPFHLWLPSAMEAPTPVSAYLHSATMVKAGVILIAKLAFVYADTPVATVVMYVGLLTVFWGGYLALRQDDLKALLAYSTVSQLGIMVALYGSGHPLAATAHLLNHAAFKATLFLVVGIIDHETGSRALSRLSGLGRKLPLTFALSIPAVLAMAGLPPLGGFVSKELFYESMLQEGLLPTAIAVAGSVLTFAYSFRLLRVFVGVYRAPKDDVHEAHAGFWLPVLPLSLLSVLFGVSSLGGEATLLSGVTNLAAGPLGFEAETLAVWHGLTLPLALSLLTWFVGAALLVSFRSVVAAQSRLIPGWNANTVYEGVRGGLEPLARFVVTRSQGAHFATHLRWFWLAVAAIGAVYGWRIWPGELTVRAVPLEFVVVAVLIVASCAGVLASRTRLSMLIFMGLAGLASTLAYALLRAPDLALTQLLIETVTVILFLSVFRYLPVLTRHSRRAVTATADALLAAAVGTTVFVTLLAVQTPLGERIGEFFLRTSYTEAGGRNVVNVILVDFRGYDTLGEITVLAVVSISVYALLRLRTLRTPEEET